EEQRPSHQGRAEGDQPAAEPDQQEHRERQARVIGHAGRTSETGGTAACLLRLLFSRGSSLAGVRRDVCQLQAKKKTAGDNPQPFLGEGLLLLYFFSERMYCTTSAI